MKDVAAPNAAEQAGARRIAMHRHHQLLAHQLPEGGYRGRYNDHVASSRG